MAANGSSGSAVQRDRDDRWHLQESRQKNGHAQVGINAVGAWHAGQGTPEIRVVLVDTGVDLAHPALRENVRLEEARDFDHSFHADGKAIPVGRIYNRHDAHGTACAGIVAAIDHGRGPVGVSPGCKIVPVRISNNFRSASLVNAIRYAGSVGHVILLPRFVPRSAEVEQAIIEVARKVPVICASGNNGTGSLVYPASLSETIAVGACNEKGFRSTYSQYVGKGDAYLDVVAPSNDVPVEDRELKRQTRLEAFERRDEEVERRAVRGGRRAELAALIEDLQAEPNIPSLPEHVQKAIRRGRAAALRDAEGQAERWQKEEQMPDFEQTLHVARLGLLHIATTDNAGAFGYNIEPAEDYCHARPLPDHHGFGGTSAAAAQVAGVVALMLSKNDKLAVADIRAILHTTATVDYLRTEADRPPHKPSPEFGYGLVDAAAAVKAA